MGKTISEKKFKKKLFHTKISRTLRGNIAILSVLTLLGLFTALPLYIAIINSLKPLNELWVFPPRFYVVNPTLKNFEDLFSLMSNSIVPFSRYIFNTVLITVVGTAGQILFASMCAFALAKYAFPGAKIYFKIIVLSLMFSPAVTAIPNYITMSKLGLIDTYFSIIVPVFGSTLGLYLMKQFMEQINDSMLESARIDGANEWTIYWSIVMPQVKPAWLTLMVFSVQSLWSIGQSNMIFSEDLKSLNYALGQIIQAGIARAGVATAVAVIMMIPPIITFIITQSNVIQTMSNSGMKD
jgi:ABC-type glycerol-3-phosphate transport system permease component